MSNGKTVFKLIAENIHKLVDKYEPLYENIAEEIISGTGILESLKSQVEGPPEEAIGGKRRRTRHRKGRRSKKGVARKAQKKTRRRRRRGKKSKKH